MSNVLDLPVPAEPIGGNVYGEKDGSDCRFPVGGPDGLAVLGDDSKIRESMQRQFMPSDNVLVSGTFYAPVKADCGKWIICTNAANVTITINGDVFDTGDELHFIQEGIGQVSFVGGAGDDYFNLKSNSDKGTTAQYAVAHLRVNSTSDGHLYGDLDPL